jgi:multiple sugar transport system permease protein
MATSNNKKRVSALAVKYTAAVFVVVFLLFPYLFMVNKSMFTLDELGVINLRFFPAAFHFSNYGIFLNYLGNLRNTLEIVLINSFFIPFSACFCAYPLARHKFIGKKFMFMLIMSTVMVPNIVLTIPQYILFLQIGLFDTLASQWVTSFFGGGALNIFLVIQFMRTIPKEIDEAAKIDGANAFRIFFSLIFPLVINVFLLIMISTFMGLWMDFQGPLIFLKSVSKRTMALQFYVEYGNSYAASFRQHEMAAMAVVMTVVPIIFYFLFQKRMIGGLKIGGVKG